MKRFENFILRACAFTVLIVVLFFLFALVTDFTAAAINLGTFMLILFFGTIIALANAILNIKSLKIAYRLLLHYAALLISFIAVFVFAGNISFEGAAAIFSSVVIFTLLYIIVFLITYFIKRSVSTADKRIDKKHPHKNNEKKEYKSLYK